MKIRLNDQRFRLTAPVGVFFLLFAANLSLAGPSEASVLEAVWSAGGPTLAKSLKAWTLSELSHLKSNSSSEKDGSGKLVHWKGVLLSSWVEKALEPMPLNERAKVDLLLFKGSDGTQAFVPRYLVKRYPFLIAYQRDQQPMSDGPLAIVVPWTSKPQITSEKLPLATYSMTGVSAIELTSYQSKFETLFLKRRTDPAAIRGEKLFVQNCVSCHATGRAKPVGALSKEGTARSLASGGHPKVDGMPELKEKDVRALISYLNEFRVEQPTSAP